MTKNSIDTYSIQIINQPTELNIIVRCVEILAERWGWSKTMINNVNVSLEEVIANIIFYGYKDDKEHLIAIQFHREGNKFSFQVEDDGIVFNPLESGLEVDLEASVEEREVGGLGIYLVKTMMDDVIYQRIGNRNRITLIISA